MKNINIKRILFTLLPALVISAVCYSCLGSSDSSSVASSRGNSTATGQSGSLARFNVVDGYLYCVDNTTLRVFNINEGKPALLKENKVGFNIETIFTRKNRLYLGTSNGVHIFDNTNRESPKELSFYRHITSCDPVVADDNFAYATLSTGQTRCMRGVNLMDVIDISNGSAPRAVASVPMTQPIGLGFLGTDRLIVCDDGLKLFDIAVRNRPFIIDQNTDAKPRDVIITNSDIVALLGSGMRNYKVVNDTIKYVGKLEF
jgi:hypothetical protein